MASDCSLPAKDTISRTLHESLKFQSDGSVKFDIFEHQRRKLIEDIENYVGDDPLQPWLRFIKWAKETFPNDVLNSELRPFLELCANNFFNDERYCSDVRYLRVWIRYADACAAEEDKFAILEANQIGQSHSLFYEAYATYMEIRKDFLKANEIYQRGLSRHAQPSGRLENMYRCFLSRMAHRIERKKEREKTDLATREKDSHPEKSQGIHADQVIGNNSCPLFKSNFSDLQGQAAESLYQIPIKQYAKEGLRRSATAVGSGQILAYDVSLLDHDAGERCFEEARMEAWFDRQSKLLHTSPRFSDKLVDVVSKSCQHGPNKQLEKSTSDSTEKQARAKHLSDRCERAATEDHLMEDISAWNLDLSNHGCQNNDQSSACGFDSQVCIDNAGGADKTAAISVDETVFIKKFVEEATFLKDNKDINNVESVTHHGLVEPTINTKEALADIISMFNEPLPSLGLKLNDSQRKGRKHFSNSEVPVESFKVYIDEDLGTNARGQKSKISHSSSTQKIGLLVCADGSLGEPAGVTNFDKGLLKEGKENLNILSTSSMPHQQLHKEPLHCVAQPNHVEKRRMIDALTAQRVNPWDAALVNAFLSGLKPPLSHYEGFYASNRKYSGSTNLQSLKSGARNKTLELAGSSKYHLKGCIGQGAFAQVYQAHDDDNYEKTVVLKIQRPAWPWEFYIYRQLDERVPKEERSSFGYVWKMHTFTDCSIMVCDYGEHGTLQDVVNSYLATGQRMDEILCIYYTIEMLRMLETLHTVGIIHGDVKPDNLLIRNDSVNWEDWAPNRPGCWRDQGLCLIDWGRSIDINLFSKGTEFVADCKTSGFRCIEMQENRPWTYQVDTYGLCGVVHTMLHGSYMEVEAEGDADSKGMYHPKSSLKRYWNRDLWRHFFSTLLNVKNCEENPPLNPLREAFENYLMSNSQLTKKLRNLLMKQSIIMYSRK